MTKRILVADDEPLQRMNIREVLSRLDYLVVGEAADGLSAVHLARELRPDLILMDIRLPGIDGIAAAEMLFSEKIAPVVLLTAFSDQELVERAKAAGVVNYLLKPLRECEIAPAMEIALARSKALHALEEQAHNLSEQLESRKVIERAKGLLMEQRGISEQEAFSKIRQASMNRRMSMREVAAAILLNSEI